MSLEELSIRVERAREQALQYLDRRMRSRSELAAYLERKGHEADAIEEAMAALAGIGLLDDRAYARAFARDRIRFHPRGYRLIAAELGQRGVAREDVDAALAEGEEAFPEAEVAADLAARHAARLARYDEEDRRRRLRALLARKGFRHDSVTAVLDPRW